jgi:hypothetical protein
LQRLPAPLQQAVAKKLQNLKQGSQQRVLSRIFTWFPFHRYRLQYDNETILVTKVAIK